MINTADNGTFVNRGTVVAVNNGMVRCQFLGKKLTFKIEKNGTPDSYAIFRILPITTFLWVLLDLLTFYQSTTMDLLMLLMLMSRLESVMLISTVLEDGLEKTLNFFTVMFILKLERQAT